MDFSEKIKKFFKKMLWHWKLLYFCSGDMAERSIAAVLKTVIQKCIGGSNPSVSAESNSKGLLLFYKKVGERCQSGRMGRSRKPLNAMRSKGSNPFLSAKYRCNWFIIIWLYRFCLPCLPKISPKNFKNTVCFTLKRVKLSFVVSFCPKYISGT